jgi:hypothetical protein
LIQKRQASNVKEAISEVIAKLSLYARRVCKAHAVLLKIKAYVSVESAAVVIARNANMKIAAKGHQNESKQISSKDIFILKDEDVLIIPKTFIWCSNVL